MQDVEVEIRRSRYTLWKQIYNADLAEIRLCLKNISLSCGLVQHHWIQIFYNYFGLLAVNRHSSTLRADEHLAYTMPTCTFVAYTIAQADLIFDLLLFAARHEMISVTLAAGKLKRTDWLPTSLCSLPCRNWQVSLHCRAAHLMLKTICSPMKALDFRWASLITFRWLLMLQTICLLMISHDIFSVVSITFRCLRMLQTKNIQVKRSTLLRVGSVTHGSHAFFHECCVGISYVLLFFSQKSVVLCRPRTAGYKHFAAHHFCPQRSIPPFSEGSVPHFPG